MLDMSSISKRSVPNTESAADDDFSPSKRSRVSMTEEDRNDKWVSVTKKTIHLILPDIRKNFEIRFPPKTFQEMESCLHSRDQLAVLVGPNHLSSQMLEPYLDKFKLLQPITPLPLITIILFYLSIFLI
jgi:hypothetical protein